MALIVLCSAKGSPGVTTTALAMTLVWPRPVLLVEADPAGGDILAGYLRGHLSGDRGLLHLAIAARHGRLAEEFNHHLVNLNRRPTGAARLLLPGLGSPAQIATVAPAWDEIAAYLSGLADAGGDVIVDAGRLAASTAPRQLFAAADQVGIVLRTTLRSVAATDAILPLMPDIDRARVPRLVAITARDYRPAEVAKRLGIGILASLPWQPAEAAALSDGRGGTTGRTGLLRAARAISRTIEVSRPATAPRVPQVAA